MHSEKIVDFSLIYFQILMKLGLFTFLLAEDDDDEFDEETLRDDAPLFLDPDPELLFGNPLTPLYFA